MTASKISRRAFLPASAALFGASALPMSASAQVRAEQVPGLILSPGVHRIDVNTTIKVDLLLQPGATIAIAPGRTLTVLGSLVAPIATIFTGPGTVDLNRSRLVCAHPEWWGAAPGDGGRDSLPALRACLRAHPTMQLLAADYYIADTFLVDRPFCRIVGSGFRGTGPEQGTRIIVASGTGDVIRVGPSTRPATVNDFLQNVTIHSVALARSMPVDATRELLPAGLRAQFLLFADFRQVSAFEHGVGFVAKGLVRSTFDDCVAFRSLPGRQAQQPYRGFLLDGLGDIGLAGGNASLFLHNCNATIGGNPAVSDPVGLLLYGAFADTFVTGFETAGMATGIRVDGKTAAIGGRAQNGHINLHLHMPIVDQCRQVGIDILDTAPEAMIDIVDPYVAVAPGAQAALRLRQMRGAAYICGGQLAGGSDMGSQGEAIGLAATASHGLQVSGLKILNHANPVVLNECAGFQLRLAVVNTGPRRDGSAVVLRDCHGAATEPLVTGQAAAFTSGIRLEGHATRLRIEATGIDAAAVGGAANRVMMGDRSVAIPSRTTDLIVDGL